MTYTEIEALLKEPARTGLLLHVVKPGGPAHEAGIRPGDTLTEANGEPLRTPRDLMAAVHPMGGDEEVKFSYVTLDGVTKTASLAHGQVGMNGVAVEAGKPAWRDLPDTEYEPDFSQVDQDKVFWFGTRFGEDPAGYERFTVRREGDEVVFDQLVWFGGEHEGDEWDYRMNVISRHRLDRWLATTEVTNVSGKEGEGQTRTVAVLGDDDVWRGTAINAKGETSPIESPAPIREAINTYAVPLLAMTMPLAEGARLTFPVVSEGDGAVRTRTRLECTGKDRVVVDGVEQFAWRFVWIHYGKLAGNEVFWIADDRRLLRIDWGPDYGGCWIEELPRERIGDGIPSHIRVE